MDESEVTPMCPVPCNLVVIVITSYRRRADRYRCGSAADLDESRGSKSVSPRRGRHSGSTPNPIVVKHPKFYASCDWSKVYFRAFNWRANDIAQLDVLGRSSTAVGCQSDSCGGS